ncbi:MAG TPA: hypothetical protein VMF08_15345 [Candidatus Sulfotelmatobacter sp.]|nr:hypothetical protein [Candidatus Sulfotelmatobacter sp.]
MSTFPQISPTAGRDAAQNADGPANVPAPAAGIAALFADVMAQALSPAPKENVTTTGQSDSEIAPRQILAANILNGKSTWLAVGMQKRGSQLNAPQSSSAIARKPAEKSDEGSKTNKNSQPPVEPPALSAAQPEIPMNQMVAIALPAVDLVSKSIPVSIASAPTQRQARDAGSVANPIIPAQSKSSVPPVSDTPENESVAGQPSAVTTAVPTTTEAADSVAKNAESLLGSAKAVIPDAKPDANNGVDSISESDSSSQQPAAQTPPDSNGISIAKQDISVNQADKTNKIAGQTEKVLPGNNVLAAHGNSPVAGSIHMEQVAATVPVGDQGSSNSPAATGQIQAMPVSSASHTSGLERTQEMITVNAVRLSDSGNNAMQVVIKPDAGTQLSLELRQHGTDVQVQVVLQHGDFNHLSQQWPDLQQRLTQRGIHLAPLADNPGGAYGSGGESFQQKQQQPAEPASELQMASLSGRQVVPTIVHAPLIARVPMQQGWETWA